MLRSEPSSLYEPESPVMIGPFVYSTTQQRTVTKALELDRPLHHERTIKQDDDKHDWDNYWTKAMLKGKQNKGPMS